MKTTVEIADGLLQEAKAVAHEQKITLRELIEDGLRLALEQKRKPKKPFRLKDGSFRGQGMVKDFTWPELRDIIYEGHGGNPLLPDTDDRG